MWRKRVRSRATVSVHRIALAGALAGAVALAMAASASAAGKPVNIGTPFDSGPPAVAVANSGAAVIDWANTKGCCP